MNARTEPIERIAGVLANRYRLEQQLAGDWLGPRYLAHDLQRGVPVVLRVLRPELAGKTDVPSFLSRLSRTAELNHTQIVPPLDSGAVDGTPYWTARYVTGTSVRDKLAVHGRPPLHSAKRLVHEVSGLLGFAAGRGFAHGGLNPDNVIVSAREVVLTDFGIVQALRVSAPSLDFPDPDDCLTLGLLAYQLLTGRFPFEAAQELRPLPVEVTPVVPPSAFRMGIEPDLDDAVLRCLTRGDGSTERTEAIERLQAATRISPATESNESGRGSAGKQLGRYTIHEVLGEGGMGTVYRAQQTDPVQREVAFKIIKRGIANRQVVARFRAERQVLAVLDHPNIAKVYDADTTESGRPFFVMELVRGVPLTSYCDEHRLGLPERVRLVIQVCDAVHHAHQKGIVHRDLKPTNILVSQRDGYPEPKVIDFGLAKVIGAHRIHDETLTQWGQRLGTPAYMSPEQAYTSSADVDTRSDVYSLGVMLYELLIGALPWEGEQGPPPGYAGREPPPSVRFEELGERRRQIAEQRRGTPSELQRRTRGDLDWIVMTAMAQHRRRRYQSAHDLARDLERYLNHEPVAARPPSAAYRLGRFVRRHRVGVAVAAVLAASLVVGLATTGVLLIRTTRAEARARTEAATAGQVTDFLVDLFSVSDPREAAADSLTARQILDRGAARIERDLEGEPLVRARLTQVMGAVYANLGLYDQAVALLRRSIAVRETVLGVEHPQVGNALHRLGNVLTQQGRYAAADTALRHAIAALEQHPDADSVELGLAVRALATLEWRAQNAAAAQAGVARAESILTRALGPDHAEVAATLRSRAVWLMTNRQFAQAESVIRRAIAIDQRTVGSEHHRALGNLEVLANLRFSQSAYGEAESLYVSALDVAERLLGNGHPRVARLLNSLAMVHRSRRHFGAAEPLYHRAIAIAESAMGPSHPDAARYATSLANLYMYQDRYAEAESLYWRSQRAQEGRLGRDHPNVAWGFYRLGELYQRQNRWSDAERMFLRTLSIQRRRLPPDSPDLAGTLLRLGEVNTGRGIYLAADTLIQRALSIWTARYAADDVVVALGRQALADLYTRQRKYREAEELYRQVLKVREAKLGADHYLVGETLERYAELLRQTGRSGEANQHATRAELLAKARTP